MIAALDGAEFALALAGGDEDEPNDMQLTDEQKQQVTQWIAQGQKLADVQRRLDEEFGARLTYMETRFLIDDLQLTPQDAAPTPASPLTDASPVAAETEVLPPDSDPFGDAPVGSGKVSVKVDEIMRPGSVVSGRVTFSDGMQAVWHMDQMGRLGMQADQAGYRPPEADVAEFQAALEKELVKLGI